MRIFLQIVAAIALAVVPATRGSAGVDPADPMPSTSNLQLVVMEAPGCIYCTIFRRDVLPSFEASEHGKDMPVRFVDVNDVEQSGLDLQSPIDILPTFVVVKNNHEVGRIPGYMGPEDFFHSINYLLSSN